MLLEMLLLTIKGNTIKFSSNLMKTQKQEENRLIKEIEQLEKKENETNSETIKDRKSDLEKLRENESRGYIISSRIQTIQ